MRRCTYCYRFHPGSPTFCAHCGRSFGVRICSRGHANHRTALFCHDCGSADLSTPAPAASLLFRFSGLALYGIAIVAVSALVLAFVLAVINSLDPQVVMGPLVSLVLMLGFLYWTTTLLPGPIKKVGKAAGHGLINVVRKRKKNH
jgi:hypothetical protein